MTGLGRSGATITYDSPTVVRKTGGSTRLRQQYELMKYLGPKVCPLVYDLDTESPARWYTMEALKPFDPYYTTLNRTIQRVLELLTGHVWVKEPSYEYKEWRSAVDLHLRDKAPWMNRDLADRLILNTEHQHEFVQVHGDCTFANLMVRKDTLLLIDPVPCRPPVPSVKEMDGARILQSIAGWEKSLLPTWPKYDTWQGFNDFHKGWSKTFGKSPHSRLATVSICRCYWWAAYNCSRILVHDQDPVSSAWAIFWGPEFEKRAMHYAKNL